MEGLAVLGAAFVLIVVSYLGLSAVLRRIPVTSPRLPTGPIPGSWYGVVEHDVPLARWLSAEERERLLRLVQVFLTEKHFEGCGGLTVTEEMKIRIAAEACLLVLNLEGPCYPTLRTVLVYPHGFVPKFAGSPGTGEIARSPVPLIGESWGDGQGRVLRRRDGGVLREAGPARARASGAVHAAAAVLPPGSSAASRSVTSTPRRLIDVSHTIEHGMVTYPGLPVPVVSDWLPRDASQARYAPGTTFQIGKI